MLFPISRVQEHHQSRKRGRVYESDEFDIFDETSMASEESKEGSVESSPLNVSTTRDGPSPGDVDDSFVPLTDSSTRARQMHSISETPTFYSYQDAWNYWCRLTFLSSAMYAVAITYPVLHHGLRGEDP